GEGDEAELGEAPGDVPAVVGQPVALVADEHGRPGVRCGVVDRQLADEAQAVDVVLDVFAVHGHWRSDPSVDRPGPYTLPLAQARRWISASTPSRIVASPNSNSRSS